jgi:hypothetical protein
MNRLNHCLFTRVAYGSVYEKRGKDQVDIILLRGVPEPLDNFDEQAFVDTLEQEGVIVRCDADGRLADGTLHPSMTED